MSATKATPKGKQLARLFFNKKNCAGDRWICDVCNASVSQSSSGYTNLCHHVNAHHKDMIDDRIRQCSQRPSKYFQSLSYSAKTQSVLAWMECVIMGLHPFSFCEQKVIRRDFRRFIISVDALMRYMRLLTKIVDEKVKAILPDHFPIVFDGRTGGHSHYVSVFATSPSDHTKGFDSVMLAIAPMGDEDCQGADEH